MTIDQMLWAISVSKKTIKVMVPNEDYYAPRGSSTDSTIDIICPSLLEEALQSLKEE